MPAPSQVLPATGGFSLPFLPKSREHLTPRLLVIPITAAVVAVGIGFGAGYSKGVPTVDGKAVSRASNVVARLPVARAPKFQPRDARLAKNGTTNAAAMLIDLDSVEPAGHVTMADTTLAQLLAIPGDNRARAQLLPNNGLCPNDMASVEDRFCVDRYEGSLLEVLPNGEEQSWSPYVGVEGHVVRAISEPGVYPQGYISANQAKDACARSGKRLCKASEWKNACMGPEKTTYGYGNQNERRRCNDHGKSPVVILSGPVTEENAATLFTWNNMNQPELNQLEGTLAKSGEHEGCTNGYGVYDMVGNLHEWVDDPGGTFLGGYYQDIHQNGDGCQYRTMAHEAWYHDYSTGFRCCADVAQ
jgi:sulfatase modifying factor 1